MESAAAQIKETIDLFQSTARIQNNNVRALERNIEEVDTFRREQIKKDSTTISQLIKEQHNMWVTFIAEFQVRNYNIV